MPRLRLRFGPRAADPPSADVWRGCSRARQRTSGFRARPDFLFRPISDRPLGRYRSRGARLDRLTIGSITASLDRPPVAEHLSRMAYNAAGVAPVTDKLVRIEITAAARLALRNHTLSLDGLTSLEEAPGWDSMVQVQIIIDLEDKFRIQFAEVELDGLSNIDRLIATTLDKADEKA